MIYKAVNWYYNIIMMGGHPNKCNADYLLSMLPGTGGSAVSRVDLDRLTKDVLPDDRVLIANIVNTIQVLRANGVALCTNFEVVRNSKGYDLISTLSSSDREFTISHNDMEVIQSVSLSRINSIFVQASRSDEDRWSVELVVRVFRSDFPLTYSSVQISNIGKRCRLT
jgi:hypothetical protein